MIADTDFVIDLMRGKPSAIEKMQDIEETGAGLHMSTVTLVELAAGIPKTKHPAEEQERIENVARKIHLLALTRDIAHAAGVLHGTLDLKAQSPGIPDCIIAATAVLTNEILLTGNVKHYNKVPGLKLETY